MSETRVHLSPEALEICQVLLDHHWTLKRAPRRPPFHHCLIEYSDLCAAAGFPRLPRNVDVYLDEITEWCVQNGWPPIVAIAVKPSVQPPDYGCDDEPGCSEETWLEDAQRCLDFDFYPRSVIS